jgi:hypothetical protein
MGEAFRIESERYPKRCGLRRSRASVPVDAGPVVRTMPGRVDAVGRVSTMRWARVNVTSSAMVPVS